MLPLPPTSPLSPTQTRKPAKRQTANGKQYTYYVCACWSVHVSVRMPTINHAFLHSFMRSFIYYAVDFRRLPGLSVPICCPDRRGEERGEKRGEYVSHPGSCFVSSHFATLTPLHPRLAFFLCARAFGFRPLTLLTIVCRSSLFVVLLLLSAFDNTPHPKPIFAFRLYINFKGIIYIAGETASVPA